MKKRRKEKTPEVPTAAPPAVNRRWLFLSCLLALIALDVFVYFEVRNYPLINYDDMDYVGKNPAVQQGITLEGLKWALTSGAHANWHPLTWMSHMLDVQLFGMDTGMHHSINVLLHIVNTLLLFVVFYRLTDRTGRSFFVAALFGVHPAHVESVAWVAERKDVLSTLFWMLTLLAYAAYVRKPTWRRYLFVFSSLALGLMAKPMLVTVPLVLLLLDFWPLGRISIGGDWKRQVLRLAWEKAPLFVLVAASSVVTFVVQQSGGAVVKLQDLQWYARLANALASYLAYIGKMFWPADLAVLYPYPSAARFWMAGAAVLVLAGVTVVALRLARPRPYLLTGWLWFVVTLVPVIGLVQVGFQSMADRYTYVPFVGLFVLVAWTIPDLLATFPFRAAAVATVSTAAIAACALAASGQVQYWRDGRVLWEHTLKVTSGNHIAHCNLANALRDEGQIDDALPHYLAALALNPNYPDTHNGIGAVANMKNQFGDAITHFSEALRLYPDFVEAHYNLGLALLNSGNVDDAVSHFSRALQLRPDYPEAHNNLGVVIAAQGRTDEALAHYAEALKGNPNHLEAHTNLGILLIQLKRTDEGFRHLSEVVRLNPSNAKAHSNLAGALVVQGKVEAAVREYSEAVRLSPGYADAHGRLASLLMNLGKKEEAIAHFRRALSLRPDSPVFRNGLAAAEASSR